MLRQQATPWPLCVEDCKVYQTTRAACSGRWSRCFSMVTASILLPLPTLRCLIRRAKKMAASSLFASSAEMADDIFALLASSDDHSYKATTEDVVVCGPTSSGDTHVLEATSAAIDGGGLAWKVAADGSGRCGKVPNDVRDATRRRAQSPVRGGD